MGNHEDHPIWLSEVLLREGPAASFETTIPPGLFDLLDVRRLGFGPSQPTLVSNDESVGNLLGGSNKGSWKGPIHDAGDLSVWR